MLLLAAGCGGAEESDGHRPAESVVGDSVVGRDQQNVRCEPAPDLTLPDDDRAVFRCSFEQEQDVSGAMSMLDRCYVSRMVHL